MPFTAHQESEPPSRHIERFPLKLVFLVSLIPALLGLFSGLFILPPRMSADPATGLLTWIHFTQGGTWNTISVPDPNDISQLIEVAITWWPPGQYLFFGLLNTAGLSLGHAALLLSFFSTLSGSIGLAALARDLGAPIRALPWVAAALACSHYNLVNYNSFSGGEVLIMGFWPWAALTAWNLRNNSKKLVFIVPIFFLLGSFIKYSFAIYAICILLFMWSEKIRGIRFTPQSSLSERLGRVIASTVPLMTLGVVYVVGRELFSSSGRTPIEESSRYLYNFKEILGYVPISPLTSAATLKNLLSRSLGESTSTLPFLSPLALIFYVYLIFKRQIYLRFFGITALTTVLILSTFHFLNYAVSLEDRHYQQAGALCLVAVSAHAFDKKRMSWLMCALIAGGIVFGIYNFSTLIYDKAIHSPPVIIKETGLSWYISREAAEKLISIAAESENSIIAVPYQEMALELAPFCHPSTRLFFTHSLTFIPASSYRGRAPRITIIEPVSTAKSLKSRFVDYADDEWTSYTINGLRFWQVGYSEP